MNFINIQAAERKNQRPRKTQLKWKRSIDEPTWGIAPCWELGIHRWTRCPSRRWATHRTSMHHHRFRGYALAPTSTQAMHYIIYNSPTVTHDRLKTKLYIYVTQETKNNLNLCHREYISPCRERDKTWSCMHSKPLDTFSPGFRLLFLITTSSDGRCCRSAEMPLLCLQPWHSSDSILSRPDGTTYICPKI